MKLNEKIALVTGAARRVGKTIALELAKIGANVIVHYRNSEDDANQTVSEIRSLGKDAVAIRADISSVKEIEGLVTKSVDRFGRIDILINNAAVFPHTSFGEITEEEWDKTLDTNMKGCFFCAQDVSRLMLKQGSGKIINIADVGGLIPWTGYIPYSISKAGLIMMTKCLAKALAPKIQVNAIAPGPVLLPEGLTEKEKQNSMKRIPLQRIGLPEDVARTVIFLLTGSDYITGETIVVDGGRRVY